VECQTIMTQLDITKLQEEKSKLVQKVEALSSTCKELRSRCEQLEVDNTSRAKELEKIEKHLKLSTFEEDSFKNNDEVWFYTGLTNWNILLTLFTYLQSYLQATSHTSLTAFQQLMLTLMQLRLSLSGWDPGYWFGVHSSTVSCTFNTVLDVMYAQLKCLIIWAERRSKEKSSDGLLKTFSKLCSDY